MQYQGKQLNFTGQSIYVGIDVGKRSWSVSIMTKDFEHKTFTQPPVTCPRIVYQLQVSNPVRS